MAKNGLNLSDIMHVNQITSIEELALLLRVYPVRINDSATGEDIVNEIFTVTP